MIGTYTVVNQNYDRHGLLTHMPDLLSKKAVFLSIVNVFFGNCLIFSMNIGQPAWPEKHHTKVNY